MPLDAIVGPASRKERLIFAAGISTNVMSKLKHQGGGLLICEYLNFSTRF